MREQFRSEKKETLGICELERELKRQLDERPLFSSLRRGKLPPTCRMLRNISSVRGKDASTIILCQ